MFDVIFVEFDEVEIDVEYKVFFVEVDLELEELEE